jgi:hypothetical protein
MLFYTVFFIWALYELFGSDIRLYLWNKKTPQEKYRLWRKARADYNHANGIVDEFQYDYLLNPNDVRLRD